MKTFEVELKFKIDQQSWQKILAMNTDIRLVQTETEEDIYYESIYPENKLAIQDKALRIRNTIIHPLNTYNTNSHTNAKIELTFKGPKLRTGTKTREEYNITLTSLNDPIMHILDGLGFKQAITIIKIRNEYQTVVNEYPIILTFDQLDELGTFVELEIIIDKQDNIDNAESVLKEYWTELLRKANINDESVMKSITTSYLELILAKREQK